MVGWNVCFWVKTQLMLTNYLKEINCLNCSILASNYLTDTWLSPYSHNFLHILQIHSDWSKFLKVAWAIAQYLCWSFVSFKHIVCNRIRLCLQYLPSSMNSSLGPCSMFVQLLNNVERPIIQRWKLCSAGC